MAEKESKRIVRKGNDLFWEVRRPDNDEIWLVSNWDLWFLVVLLNEFGGDWQKMITYFRENVTNIYIRHNTEAKLSHLRHLQETMQQAGLDPISVLGPEAMALLKKEKRHATNKVLKQELPWNDQSYWMIHTPSYIREERSRRGYWAHFAISPEIYAQPLVALFKTHGLYEEDQSFALERKLSAHLDKQEKKASVPQLAALYRAFLTVMLEKIEIVDCWGCWLWSKNGFRSLWSWRRKWGRVSGGALCVWRIRRSKRVNSIWQRPFTKPHSSPQVSITTTYKRGTKNSKLEWDISRGCQPRQRLYGFDA